MTKNQRERKYVELHKRYRNWLSVQSKVAPVTRRKYVEVWLNSFLTCGPGNVVRVSTGYGLDGPGIESRWGGEIFCTCPDWPWFTSSLLYNGCRVIGVKSDRSVTLTPHPLLVPWSRKCIAIPLLTLWAVRPVQSLSARTEPQYLYRTSVPVQSLSACTEPRCLYRASVPVQSLGVCTEPQCLYKGALLFLLLFITSALIWRSVINITSWPDYPWEGSAVFNTC